MYQDTNTRNLRPYILLATCVFAYLAATIFQGVNWTDEGYHYALADLLFSNFHGSDPQFSILHWLSVLLGGWWMKIIPKSMLWARLEWVFLWTVVACLSLSLARRVHKGPLSVVLVFAAMAMATFHNPACVEYNLLAAAIVCVLGILYASILDRPTGKLARYVVAGAVLALCIPAKITLAPMVPVFFAFLLWARCPWKGILFACAAFAALSCALFAALSAYGALDNYLAAIAQFTADKGPGEHHGLSNLIGIYSDTLLSSAGYGLALLLTSRVAAALATRFTRPRLAVILCSLAVLAHVVLVKNLSFAIVGVYAFALLLALGATAKADLHTFKLLALLSILAANGVAGSNFPAHVTKYMLPALLPVTCLQLLKRFPQGKGGTLRTQITGLAVGLLLTSVAFRLTNPYLDLRQRWLLTSPVDTPVTRMIATSAAKAQVIKDLYEETCKLLRPGDPVIAFPDLPLAHYLLGHPPALQTPWIEEMPPKLIDKRLDALPLPLPPVVVAAFDPQTRQWGEKDFSKPPFAPTYTAMFTFLKKHGYRVAWKSDFFSIHLPPLSHGE